MINREKWCHCLAISDMYCKNGQKHLFFLEINENNVF